MRIKVQCIVADNIKVCWLTVKAVRFVRSHINISVVTTRIES